MKSRRSLPPPNPFQRFRSPDYYPAEKPKTFPDFGLGLLLFALLSGVVAFGLSLVMQ